jgi:hypothetical protein
MVTTDILLYVDNLENMITTIFTEFFVKYLVPHIYSEDPTKVSSSSPTARFVRPLMGNVSPRVTF